MELRAAGVSARARHHLVLSMGLLVGLLAPAEARGGDFLAEYKKGVRALEERRFREAAEALERAVAGRRESSPRLAKRLYLKPYIPHFYLGSAYLHLGNCQGAISAWNEAERNGVIVHQPQIRELRQRRALCTERLGAHGEVLEKAEDALEGARQVFALVSELSADRRLRGFWSRGRPSGADRRRRAEQRLSNAERRLEQGRDRLSSLAPLHQAASAAKEARYLFQALLEDARSYLRNLDRREETRQADLATVKIQSRQALQQAAALPADSPLLRELRGRLRGILDVVSNQGEEVPPEDQDGLEEALADLQAVLRAPDDRLQAAARNYLAGRYGKALELLVGEFPEDRRTAAQTLLLRAAAAFSLHRETPGGRSVLVDQARTDLRSASADLPEAPGARIFSPAFRSFYAATLSPLRQLRDEAPPDS